MSKINHLTTSLVLITALLSAGCTDQKAQAVQTAATNFSMQAKTAIENLHDLFESDIAASFPADEQSATDVLADFQNLGAAKVNAAGFSEILKGPLVPGTSPAADDEFKKLAQEYATFSAMYRSLRAGRLFSRKAVADSEAVAVKLTVQMIRFAEHIRLAPYQLRARRVVLIAKINRALTIKDADARKAALTDLAQQTIQLRNDENAANDNAIKQCLKAAAAGQAVIQGIRDYGKLSVGDILGLVQDSLQFASDIAGNKDVTSLLTHFKGVEDAISKDPHWSPMLNLDVTPVRGEKNGK